MEIWFCAICNHKKAIPAVLISDFKAKGIPREKYGCYLMIKSSGHQEEKTILNSYAHDNTT